MQPKELLDWLTAVEETLDFKEVLEDKRIGLVATCLRGRASAGWQQLKATRMRKGKSRTESWEKMKKRLHAEFLPHNYVRTLYYQLQHIHQGNKTVDMYTKEFYNPITRNGLLENEDQLVARYIGGLCQNIQDVLNLYDPFMLLKARQKALQVAKQSGRSNPTDWSSSTAVPKAVSEGSVSATNVSKPTPGDTSAKSSSFGGRCFKCGELGHKASEC